MSDAPRIWKVFKAGCYDNGELIDEIDLTYRSLGQPEMVEFSAYIEALQEIGRANAQAESLTSENTRLRARLYEEVMDAYDALPSTRKARYEGPGDYADSVFASEGVDPPPSHKGEDLMKWISVEERLPQEGDGSMGFVVEWRDGEDPGPYIALWDSISGTHWVPLPPDPGED